MSKNEMRKRKLLIFSEPFQAELLKMLLEKNNFNVFINTDPQETIERAKAIKPDLILIASTNHPVLSGWELCKKLKGMKELKNTKIIISSAFFDEAEYIVKALICGADAYLPKPFKEKELKDVIISCLEN